MSHPPGQNPCDLGKLLESGRYKNVILDSIADGVFAIDADWRICSFNRAAEEITGISREEAMGRQCSDVFRASICESACALRETMKTGRPLINRAIYIVRSDGTRIPVTISTALLKDDNGQTIGGVETFRDLSVEEELRRELAGRYMFEDMVSKNTDVLRIFEILPDIAESESTVLILGESGTGKELVARAIHNMSPRAERPLVIVNCAAIPDTLLESELFGHKAGSFTDARKDRVGRFALAHGGTIFLDEIGDVSPALQARLLRVLQDGTYEPLGATRTEKADVRVVAATNRDLDAMVATGEFRGDLYYRINVIAVNLPPLRDRREDVPLLVDHFIESYNRLKRKEISGVSPDVLELLMMHDYPGNIRELENIIEHAFVMCRSGTIRKRHLPAHLLPIPPPTGDTPTSLSEAERAFLLSVLERNRWHRAATARELGIHKTTLWRKMKRLEILAPPRRSVS
ncbi:MAG: sigma 54-interacting transcriptional regulator [Candidatus Eisenbacteria bacterium]